MYQENCYPGVVCVVIISHLSSTPFQISVPLACMLGDSWLLWPDQQLSPLVLPHYLSVLVSCKSSMLSCSHHHRRPLRVDLRANERHPGRDDAFPVRAWHAHWASYRRHDHRPSVDLDPSLKTELNRYAISHDFFCWHRKHHLHSNLIMFR